MTEKQVFTGELGLTNIADLFMGTTHHENPRYEIYTESTGYKTFLKSEWDIEVIFTKRLENGS